MRPNHSDGGTGGVAARTVDLWGNMIFSSPHSSNEVNYHQLQLLNGNNLSMNYTNEREIQLRLIIRSLPIYFQPPPNAIHMDTSKTMSAPRVWTNRWLTRGHCGFRGTRPFATPLEIQSIHIYSPPTHSLTDCPRTTTFGLENSNLCLEQLLL